MQRALVGTPLPARPALTSRPNVSRSCKPQAVRSCGDDVPSDSAVSDAAAFAALTVLLKSAKLSQRRSLAFPSSSLARRPSMRP